MGKLGYFFTTFVGAIPAGFGLYLLIAEVFLEQTEKLNSADDGTMLLVISITITVCMALIVLTPFMVLVFYKDTRPKLAAAGAGAVAGTAAAGGRDDEADGFGDAIPDDFDEEELATSVGDDFDDEYEDGGGFDDEYATDDDDYDDDFEDLDF